MATTKTFTADEITQELEVNEVEQNSSDSEPEEENEGPPAKTPSDQKMMEMASDMLLYAKKSPEDKRAFFVDMATQLYEAKTTLIIKQKMASKQKTIDSFIQKR